MGGPRIAVVTGLLVPALAACSGSSHASRSPTAAASPSSVAGRTVVPGQPSGAVATRPPRLTAQVPRAAVGPGGTLSATGTSGTCGVVHAAVSLVGPTPAVDIVTRRQGDGYVFTVKVRVAKRTRPQLAHLVLSTGCPGATGTTTRDIRITR